MTKDIGDRYYPATGMPDWAWWQELWPDPEGVMRKVGAAPGVRTVELCCGDGYFTAPLARLVHPAEVIDRRRAFIRALAGVENQRH